MTIDELTQSREAIKTDFTNLGDPIWVGKRLEYLRGAYDNLTNLIDKETANATSTEDTEANSNVNPDEQSV
jgi:two-component SAPR family response regulator